MQSRGRCNNQRNSFTAKAMLNWWCAKSKSRAPGWMTLRRMCWEGPRSRSARRRNRKSSLQTTSTTLARSWQRRLRTSVDSRIKIIRCRRSRPPWYAPGTRGEANLSPAQSFKRTARWRRRWTRENINVIKLTCKGARCSRKSTRHSLLTNSKWRTCKWKFSQKRRQWQWSKELVWLQHCKTSSIAPKRRQRPQRCLRPSKSTRKTSMPSRCRRRR